MKYKTKQLFEEGKLCFKLKLYSVEVCSTIMENQTKYSLKYSECAQNADGTGFWGRSSVCNRDDT